MASRYWVGGSADWDATAGSKWSTTSGGAGGSAVPTSTDAVFLDAASGAVTVTITTDPTFGSLDCTGFTGTLTQSGFPSVSFYGSLTLGSGMTFDVPVTWKLTGTAGGTITTNGVVFNATSVQDFTTGAPTWQFGGNFTLDGTWSQKKGTFKLNDHTVTLSFLDIGSAILNGTTTLTIGTGLLVLTASSGNAFRAATTNTITAFPSGTIKMTGNAATFAGAGKTYSGTVWFSSAAGTGTQTITGANTYGTLKDDGGGAHTLKFPNTSTQTMTTFNVNGTAGNLISLRSVTAGTKFTLAQASGTVNATYLDIKDSTASGGATWNADGNSTDSGNNTGWNFAVGTQTLTPSLISFSPTFYAPTVLSTKELTPSLLTNTNTFPSAQIALDQTLTPSLFTNSASFHTPVITTATTLSAGLFTNTQSFYAATVANTTQFLTPSVFTNSQTFYTPLLEGGAPIILPSLFTNAQSFFAPTVALTTQFLTPSLFTNTPAFFSPVVSAAGSLFPSLFTNSQSFPSSVLSKTYSLTPDLFTNTHTFYSGAVAYSKTLTPSLFTNTNSFFTPALSRGLLPSLFTNTNVFKSPQIGGTLPQIKPPPATFAYFPPGPIFFSPTVRHTAPSGDGNRHMRIVHGKGTLFQS